MSERQLSRLRERRATLLEELRQTPNLMRGTVYQRERKCGRASCTCATGGPRHAGVQFNVTLGGRTRTRYVRQGERAAIEAMVGAYHRLWKVVDELTEVNLLLWNAEPGETVSR